MGCRNIRFPRWVRGYVWAFCSLQLIFSPILKAYLAFLKGNVLCPSSPLVAAPSDTIRVLKILILTFTLLILFSCQADHTFSCQADHTFSCQADKTFFLSGWSYWCWWKSPDRVAPVNPDQPWRDPNLLATLTIKYQIYFLWFWRTEILSNF